MASHMMSWLGNMFFPVHTIIVSHQNLPLLFSFPTSCHKRLMAPRVSIIRQVIQIDGLAYGSCPIIRARGVQTIVPQSFRPPNTEEEHCRNPTLAKCEDETHTPKVGDLGSSKTPECLEFDSRGQNTLHWGVLGVIGKVLKFRCPKWPLIGHLDIYSPSFGQKKGRESKCQFDSRPLKVRNRPLLDIRF